MADVTEVAVIGGGLGGLAAALELRAQGHAVIVLEQSDTLGGKAGTRTTPYGDFPTGPTSFNGRHPAFWRLLRLLGIEDSAVRLSPRSAARFIVRNGKLEAIHPNPLSVLTTGALSFSDKFALARDFLSSSRGGTGADESLDAFLERRFGRELVDHFFAAVLTGVFAGDLTRLSATTCMPSLVTAEKEYGSILRGALQALRHPEDGTRPGLYSFREGFALLGQTAAAQLTARTGVTVTALRRLPHGVGISAQGPHGPFELVANEVVIATEAFTAAPLLESLSPEASALLRTFPYAPVTLLQWAERFPGESRLPQGFGYLVAPIEQHFAMGTLFVGDLLGDGVRRFSTFIGGALQPDRAALSDEQLCTDYGAELTGITGGTFGQLAGVVRWPRAVFQPPVGHPTQLEKLQGHLAQLPVALAGSYLGGAAMKDALMSGFAAAETIARRWPHKAPAAAKTEVRA